MELTVLQQEMLDGKYEKGTALAMKIQVAIGDSFDAKRMVPISLISRRQWHSQNHARHITLTQFLVQEAIENLHKAYGSGNSSRHDRERTPG